MGSVKNQIYLMMGIGLLISGCSNQSKRGSGEVLDGGNKAQELAVGTEQRKLRVIEQRAPAEPKDQETRNDNEQLNQIIKSGPDSRVRQVAQQILLNEPGNVRALNALAVVALREGKLSKAKYFIDRGLAKEEKSWELWNNLGLILWGQGEKNSALKAFRRAFELNPKNSMVASNLGFAFLEHRDFSRAAPVLEFINPDQIKDWKILSNLGIISAYSGKVDRAEDFYNRALKQSPNNREILFNMAVLYIEHAKKQAQGLDTLAKMKFMGLSGELRNKVNELENRAKLK
jgi:Flp pilus assembly protein TadD